MSATAITITPAATAPLAVTAPGTIATAPPATLARSTAPPSRTPPPSATPTARPAQPTRPPRTSTSAATVVTSGPFRLVATIDPAVEGWPVYDLRADPAAPGHLQVIMERGYMTVRMADGQAWSQAAYPDAVVIGVDAAGFIWMVRDDGDVIYATDGMSDRAYGPESGWTSVENYRELAGNGVVQDPNAPDVLWLATDQDFRRFDGGHWTIFTRDDVGMAAAETEDMSPEYDVAVFGTPPHLWAFGCDWGGPGPAGGPGARWLDGDTWRGADSPVASGCVTVIVADPAGRVWIARDDELWRFDAEAGTWAEFTPPVPEGVRRFGYTIELALDSGGNPWALMSTCGGASCEGDALRLRYVDGEWTQVPAPPEETAYGQLAFDRFGTPWLFGLYAVWHMQSDAWIPAGSLDVHRVCRDADGSIWVYAGDESSDGPLGIWELLPP